MGFVLAAAMIFANAEVDIHLAPDQPIPYVYVEEPLVAEFLCTEDARGSAHVALVGANGAEQTFDFKDLVLRAHRPYWQVLETAAVERGFYEAVFGFDGNAGHTERTARFVRIDRPYRNGAPPIGVACNTLDGATLLALGGIPLRDVRLRSDTPDLDSAGLAAASAGVSVGLAMPAEEITAGDTAALRVLGKLGDAARLCELEVGGGNPDQLPNAVQTLRQHGVRAPIGVVVRSAAGITELLSAGAGAQFARLVFLRTTADCPEAATVRDAAERAGYENFAYEVVDLCVPSANRNAGPELTRRIVTDLAAGVCHVTVDSSLVYTSGEFRGAYAHLSALSHRLRGARYVGSLDVPSPAAAHVFRAGSRWTAVVWGGAEPQEVAVGFGAPIGVEFADAANNPLPLPEAKDGRIALPVTPAPRYLSGTGGTLLAEAARNAARREARDFLAAEGLRERLSAESASVVEVIALPDSAGPSRLEFLKLLTVFPELEREWHNGAFARSVAVPALARLARLVRSLCVLEQEENEPFVDPLDGRQRRCEEFQSAYITGSGGPQGTRERGDWLFEETNRLIAEAQGLAEEGRPIEADAVASLAEWRARSLEYAALAAPLGGPDPYVEKQMQNAEEEAKAKAVPEKPAEARKKKTRK